MMMRQTPAYSGNETVRRLQMQALTAPMSAETSTDLVMPRIHDHVKDDEEGGEAGQSHDHAQQTAFDKDWFPRAHGLEYVPDQVKAQ